MTHRKMLRIPLAALTLSASLLLYGCSPGSLRVEFNDDSSASQEGESGLPASYPNAPSSPDTNSDDSDAPSAEDPQGDGDPSDEEALGDPTTGDQPEPILNFATFGTRCLPEGEGRYLVLSDTRVDCGADAERIDSSAMSGQLTGAVALSLDPALPDERTVQYCPDGGTCQEVTITLTLDDQGDSLSGSWTGNIDGTPRTVQFDATSCDYDTAVAPLPADSPAAGISVDDVAVYQGVKIPVVQDGMVLSDRNAPIVAGRPGVVRVFVAPEADWEAREILVRLTIDGTEMEQTFTPSSASTETNVDSTVNFEFAEGELPAGADFSVELLEVQGCSAQDANLATYRVPETETAPLDSQGLNSPLRITLVPIQYDADGSGRTPNLGDTVVERFKTEMFTHYPVDSVEFTVRNPVSTNIGLQPNGDGFGTMLNFCLNTRANDNPDPDVYYYCVIQPRGSFQEFCGQGCVGGVAPVPTAGNVGARGGIGISFGGSGEDIMVHEIGHAMGRPHSPCGGASSADPNYPYNEGLIGSWGYNVMNGQLLEPSQRADFMGYCDPSWVSDYTYAQLFDRISSVLGTQSFMVSTPPTQWRTAVVEQGEAQWGSEITLDRLPTGHAVAGELLDASGTTMQDVDVYVTPVADIDATLVTVQDAGVSGQVIDVPGIGQLELP